VKPPNNFLEQLKRKQDAAKTSEPAQRSEKPIEQMSGEELRWVALEKPAEEMTLEELQWVSSGEASRTLTRLEDEHGKPKRHNFNELKRNRRRVWK
jgi:hypothetical protein